MTKRAVATVLVVAMGVVAGAGAAGARRQPPPKRWDPRILRFVRFVEHERKLRFDHPISVDFLSDAAFRKAVRDKPTTADRHDARIAAAQLHALGLAPAGLDLIQATDDDSGELVSGFYDQDTKRITIRGNKLDNTDVRVTVVHELTHALQDQHFDLDALDTTATTTGKAFAELALVEGDAVNVETAYVASLSKQEQDSYYGTGPAIVPASVPAAVDMSLSAPYVIGPYFDDLLSAKNKHGLNAAFEAPPASDEQVLDPVAYARHDRPQRPPTPALHSGEHRRGPRDELGAFGLYLVLASRLPPETALRAATGWRGDRFIGFRRDGRDCIRDAVSGDTPRDSTEIADGLEQWAAGAAAGAATVERGKVITLTACSDETSALPTQERLDAALTVLGSRVFYFSEVGGLGLKPREQRCVGDHFALDPEVERIYQQDEVSKADEDLLRERYGTYSTACGTG